MLPHTVQRYGEEQRANAPLPLDGIGAELCRALTHLHRLAQKQHRTLELAAQKDVQKLQRDQCGRRADVPRLSPRMVLCRLDIG